MEVRKHVYNAKNNFMCFFTVCGLLVCLTFACHVILFGGSVMSFILPASIGVGDGGSVPPKIREKKIFADNYYVKIGQYSDKNV